MTVPAVAQGGEDRQLAPPEILAAEIVDQLEAALEEFRGIEEALGVE